MYSIHPRHSIHLVIQKTFGVDLGLILSRNTVCTKSTLVAGCQQ